MLEKVIEFLESLSWDNKEVQVVVCGILFSDSQVLNRYALNILEVMSELGEIDSNYDEILFNTLECNWDTDNNEICLIVAEIYLLFLKYL